jgi:competence protein ComEC
MRGAYFYGFVGAFAIGTAFALLGHLDIGESVLVLMIAVGAALLCLVRRQERVPQAICVIIVLLSGFGCGALRTSFAMYENGQNSLDAHVGEQVLLRAVVAEDPVVTSTNQKIVLKTEEEGRTIITFASVYPAFAYGDVLEARGILKQPERFVIEGSGRTFNYPAYLAKDGIQYVLDKPKLTTREEWQGSRIKQGFIYLRRTFVASIERVVPEPYAGLAAGVVLGVDGALSKDDEEVFRNAGLIHVVVVSGYNITLVGDMVARALASLPVFISSAGSLVGILAFILLTGASATAVRAGIMASLILLARLTKRHYNMQRALFFAGFIMVLHTPLILLYDPSFQLSFLATWGLGSLTPFTERLFAWMPAFLRTIAATTLATQTAVTPLLIYMSGNVSILSLPANILVLPFVPVIMIGTLLIGILGFLPAIVLLPFSIVTHGVSAYVFGIAHLIDSIPMSVMSIPAVSLWMLVTIYGILVGIVEIGKQNATPPEGGVAFGGISKLKASS